MVSEVGRTISSSSSLASGSTIDALAVGIVLQPVMGHHGALLGKPLDMMRLLAEKNDFGINSGK